MSDHDEDAMCTCGHRRWRHGDFGECTVERCGCDDFEPEEPTS